MKYNDNGTYKDIYVKAFDTLPVGTEVDYDGTTVPDGWTEVDDPNTYSTDEKRIGTYNNKPLYRKTITVDPLVHTNTSALTDLVTINDIDEIIKIDGVLWNSARTYCHQMPYVNEKGLSSKIVYTEASGTFSFSSTDTWSNAKIIFIIEYTKTTD